MGIFTDKEKICLHCTPKQTRMLLQNNTSVNILIHGACRVSGWSTSIYSTAKDNVTSNEKSSTSETVVYADIFLVVTDIYLFPHEDTMQVQLH
ncbi:hypothetical protein TNCT_698391 [Trichonephila clavata]|uniref:Uncharacterized protein n=1 Tax=Trichonephila clavata TaxID=2740835 RepID=A0A8X6IQP5_TRICU|nr:hypothetical protein TNCT_698391 [Trichonephila clavata]